MRRLSVILIISLLLNSIPFGSFASIQRVATLTEEKILPFSSSGSTQSHSCSISFDSSYKNVQVIDSYVDNGIISSSSVGSGSVNLSLRNGTYKSGSQTVTKIGTLNLTDATADNSGNIVTTARDNNGNTVSINSVSNVSGDFISATFSGSTFYIAPDTSKGELRDDPSLPIQSETVTFTAPDDNTNQNYVAPKVALKGTVDGNITVVADPATGSVTPKYDSSYIWAEFSGGNPLQKKEITRTTSNYHGYFWVDRHLDKHFACMGSTVMPNYIYRATTTPGATGYIPTGYAGDVVNYNKALNKSDLGSVDFWGYYLGATPSLGIVTNPSSNMFSATVGSKLYFTSSDLSKYGADLNSNNTLSATFEVTNSSVNLTEKFRLKEHDKEFPAGPCLPEITKVEDQSTFWSTRTYSWETIVRHFKFLTMGNYGLYGGVFRNYYPYSSKLSYKYFTKNRFYDGSLTYSYDVIENVNGYAYNGWVKIRYNRDVSITDNPPSRPGGIIATPSAITHGPSVDDYTPQNQLVYKYYYYKNSTWNYLGQTVNGTTTISWNPSSLGLDLNNLKVGVRANDLYQDGAMGENDPAAKLDITGTVTPNVLPAGENMTINAETDSAPECNQVSYTISKGYGSGTLDKTGKKYYETNIAVASGGWSYKDGNLSNWMAAFNGNVSTDGDYTQFFEHDFYRMPEEPFVFGNKGTIIIPSLNDNGYSETYNFTEKTVYDSHVSCIYNYYIAHNYAGSVFDISPYRNPTTSFGTMAYYKVARSIDSAPTWFSYSGELSWTWKGGYSKGYRAYAQIWDKQIDLPYWNKPVTITFEGNVYKVYQDGTYVGQVTGNRTMEGFQPDLNSRFRTRLYDESASTTAHYYHSLGTQTGKSVFSNEVWSLDQINLFMGGAYPDNYHIARPDLFRARYEPNTTKINFNYGGVRQNGLIHPSNLLTYIPGKLTWGKTITLPTTMKNGLYTVTLTANNGLQKSIDISFTVSTPINPDGVMPSNVNKGATYTITATSSKYVNDMKLIVFGQTYTMTYDGLNGSGDKKWKYNLTIPNNAAFGIYNQTSGPLRYAEFKAAIPSGDTASDYETFQIGVGAEVAGNDVYAAPGETVQITASTKGYCTSASVVMPTGTVNLINNNPVGNFENTWSGSYTVPVTQPIGDYDITYKGTNALMTATHPAKLHVDVFLSPVGNVPDSIETKTDFKITCRTTLHATSVSAVLNPTPGAVQYNLNLISQDATHKYWESANIQYPEGAAGGPAGKTVTGTFTTRAANGKTEADTDTGHLWEKIEVSGYEMRRTLYQDGDISKPLVETLCRSPSTRHSGSAGFILAGHEMGIKVLTKGYADKIQMNFDGPVEDYTKDNSVKILDQLTQRFEWDDVVNRGRTPEYASLDALKNYYSFPKNFTKAAKAATSLNNIYTIYYLIPYGTKQSLHSWYTLREESGSAFNIDKSKLLERIKEPFVLKLKIYSGSRYIEKNIKFDVFERWDTLFNRDIRPCIDNPGGHNPVSQSTWETTDYIEEYFKNNYN